jgi:lipopolysaccharide export system protein LptC
LVLLFLMKFIMLSGKPDEVAASAENFLLSSIQSPQASTATTQKAAIEIEEQIIQTETALQNEAEQRCTGKKKKRGF